jgi:hypothetical protein
MGIFPRVELLEEILRQEKTETQSEWSLHHPLSWAILSKVTVMLALVLEVGSAYL